MYSTCSFPVKGFLVILKELLNSCFVARSRDETLPSKEYGKEGSENPCPQQWSSQRCSAARTVMATYAVDFEWSEAQQLAGYQFAKKNCRRYDPEKSIEIMSCKALNKNPSLPSANSTASSPATQ
jgi:hypothetical protein